MPSRECLLVVSLGCLEALGCSTAEAPPRAPRDAAVGAIEVRPAPSAAPVGRLDGLPPVLWRAFDPTGFAPLPAPGPDDWLAVQSEPGQTYDELVASSPNRPVGGRRRLYLLPLGELGRQGPSLVALGEVLAAYFGLEVRTLPALAVARLGASERVNRITQRRQLHSRDVLRRLVPRVPRDAYAMLAVTMEDLYPEPSWNFVFGEASLAERVGVYSLLRYDPAFYGERRDANRRGSILRRSVKVLVHETGHMFGLQHCVHYLCLMNGSNHLAETDRQPLHLCPVCLRKLHFVVGFDVTQRDRALARVYRRVGLDDEAAWAAGRAQWVEHGVLPGDTQGRNR